MLPSRLLIWWSLLGCISVVGLRQQVCCQACALLLAGCILLMHVSSCSHLVFPWEQQRPCNYLPAEVLDQVQGCAVAQQAAELLEPAGLQHCSGPELAALLSSVCTAPGWLQPSQSLQAAGLSLRAAGHVTDSREAG